MVRVSLTFGTGATEQLTVTRSRWAERQNRARLKAAATF
jgi:hypothetical protein